MSRKKVHNHGILPRDDHKRLSRREVIKKGAQLTTTLAGGVLLNNMLPAQALAAGEFRNYRPATMTYRRLGKTNMMVSALSLGGAANYGYGDLANSNPDGYRQTLSRLLELGVNYFDTSNDPESNSGYGTEDDFAWLCQGSRRDQVFISTKVDNVDSITSIKNSVEDSLTRLQTDHVDLVYLHNGRGADNISMCYDALDQLIAEGKVRFKGMTAHSTSLLTDLLTQNGDRTDAIMGFYSPSTHWTWHSGSVAEWETVFQLAQQKDVGVVAMKILLSAVTPWADRQKTLMDDTDARGRLQPHLSKGYSIPQSCIRWALENTAIHTALIGMRNVVEVNENAAAMTQIATNEPVIPPMLQLLLNS